jgi:pyruvate dehydrogenase E2 component (dihydrolipoamide acetyltransferase)
MVGLKSSQEPQQVGELVDILLPDIGDYKDVPVVELNVGVGDVVTRDMPLMTIESDKATMEVPSPSAGVVHDVQVSVGKLVSRGTLLMRLSGVAGGPQPQTAVSGAAATPSSADLAPAAPQAALAGTENPKLVPASSLPAAAQTFTSDMTHASPSVRALARELGVSLAEVRPTGAKGRILRHDVANHVKQARSLDALPTTGSEPVVASAGQVNFEKFGAVERTTLSRIQKISGAHLWRSWNTIPHVTNFDKADVTDTEAFRQNVNSAREAPPAKLTMVSILIKASALALRQFPTFNASLDGDELVLKNYVHIGFAVDTPKGLMVPVIRDCDRKGLLEIASDMRMLADKAAAGALSASDMQGGCFSVSSLGGIGGCGFTPIINAPEVAILGAGRSATEAVWDGACFKPRLILPISLSWDHRVVDGVAAARFLGFVAASLSDLRRAAL